MNDSLYCAEQIKIPPDLPEILKNYAKHIIKTQPADIIASSAEYFGRLAKQKSQSSGKKLTDLQLEAFYGKFAHTDRALVSKKEVEAACNDNGVVQMQMNEIIAVGGWQGDRIPWLKFWFLLVASASGTLPATIESICKLLANNGKIAANIITECFQFLADKDPDIDQTSVDDTFRAIQALQSGKEMSCAGVIDAIRKELKYESTTVSAAPQKAAAPAQVISETNDIEDVAVGGTEEPAAAAEPEPEPEQEQGQEQEQEPVDAPASEAPAEAVAEETE
ncbi:uncharacterized protein BJ171DRAFT_492758 [Polychytrium aggregatum]|uniref:uncharacterized protein n=1 Tax=Polychytrium aggregatum TaxID=110093 RepID=UPI0022FE9429|nr:uncharacterized protein BJ171DRAFT_492758 [Polychytrium aggregatum]KAI9207443.1 hypothetical protein BJ171DRAFT_492758 [Polychytrium aggregatum]